MVMARPKWQPVTPAVPADDPLPWLTATWSEAEASLPVKSQEEVTAALSAAEKALNSLVIGLADADVSYRLMLGKSTSAPAATNHGEHLVFVGTKPWSHYATGHLTFGQMVAVFTGLAYHEVGHIVMDSEDSELMRGWADDTYTSERARALAHATDNVCRDLRLEAAMQQRYPGFAEALQAAMWWVSKRFDEVEHEDGSLVPNIEDVQARLGTFVKGTRYPWECDWTGFESLRDYWADWAARSETAYDISDVQALVSEAVERILDGAPDMDPPKPPDTTTCGPSGSEPKPDGDDTDDQPTEGGDDESQPGDDESTTTTSGGDDGDSESEDSDEQSGKGAEPTDDDTEGDSGDGDDGDDAGDDEIDTEGDDLDDFGGGSGLPDDESSDGDDEPGGESEDSTDGDASDGDDSDSDVDDIATETGEGDNEVDTDSESTVDRRTADDSENSESIDETTAEDLQRQSLGCGTKMAEDPDDVNRQAAITDHARSSKTNKSMTFEYNAGGRIRKRTITEVRLNKHADEVYGYAGDDQQWQHYETEMTASLGYETHRIKGETKPGYRRTKSDVQAQRALMGVMHSARKGPGAPEFAQRTGRIDRRRVGRLAYGEGRVFQRPDAAAPQRVKVGILVDASGSMGWGETRPNIERAAQAARDLAGAFESLPWAEGFVAAHTTAFGAGPVYIPIWHSGEPLVYMDDLLTISMNGNEDGFAVAYTAEQVLDGLQANQRGVVIVISDGAPAYSDGETHTRTVVDEYRKRGLRIVSVAISEDMREYTQHQMYGAKDVVAYDKNATVFAQRMAQVIGSSI